MSYSVILADPPWNFEVWDKGTGSGRSPKYPTMTLDDICNLPVSRLTADNCALFLWCIWPSIFDAKQVIEAWGFTYRTLAWEWVKMNKSGVGFGIGLGYYTRANMEPCLLAVKGNMPRSDKGIRNLLVASKSDHSKKPPEQYPRIERLYPNQTYLELFARQSYSKNWDHWGNNTEGGINIYDY